MDSRLLMYAILESDSAAIHFEVSGQISTLCSPPGHHSGIRNLGTVPGRGWGGRGGNPHPQLPVLREFQADVGREARGCRRTRSLWNTGTGQGGGAMAQLKWDATPKTTGGAGEKAQWVKSGCTSLCTRF